MQNAENSILLRNGAAVGQPASGQVGIIADASGVLYKLASDGTRTPVSSSGAVETIARVSGSPATSLQLPLVGDTDGDYWIDFYFSIVQNACTLDWRPNNSNSNLLGIWADPTVGASARTDWLMATNAALSMSSGDKVYGQMYIRARSGGQNRFCWITSYVDAATDRAPYMRGILTETATPLSRLDAYAGVAAGLGVGSYMRSVALNTANT